MAIIISTQYPGKTNAPSAAYPQGSARNVTISGDGTGTPWEQQLVNDVLGFLQALLLEGGITPSGSPDTALASDYLDGLKVAIKPTGYSITNPPAGGPLKTFDPLNYSDQEIADVLATLLAEITTA